MKGIPEVNDPKKINNEKELNAALQHILDNLANLRSILDPTTQMQLYAQSEEKTNIKSEELSALLIHIKEQHDWLLSLNPIGMKDFATRLADLGNWANTMSSKPMLSKESIKLLNSLKENCVALSATLKLEGPKEQARPE